MNNYVSWPLTRTILDGSIIYYAWCKALRKASSTTFRAHWHTDPIMELMIPRGLSKQLMYIEQNRGQASRLQLSVWVEKPSTSRKQCWVSRALLITVPVLGRELPVAELDDLIIIQSAVLTECIRWQECERQQMLVACSCSDCNIYVS